MLKENIDRIGYYKYESPNNDFGDIISAYPINDFILEYIRKTNNIKFEFDGDKPKLIDDKLIVLI